MLLLGGKHFEIERWRQSSHFLKVLIEGGFGIKTGTIGCRKHIDIQFICCIPLYFISHDNFTSGSVDPLLG